MGDDRYSIAVAPDRAGVRFDPPTLNELINRLERVGLDRRDPDTGEIVERSASSAIAARLRTALLAGTTTFVLEDDERGFVWSTLNHWLDDVSADAFPEPAWQLRDELHDASS